ncbi:MAG TPA: choice-of-anchor tandem repeat GloVer-containing protein [Rhizomicrobium sp.]|jgi:uncharacterized repeat protein (TIGR03803 family)
MSLFSIAVAYLTALIAICASSTVSASTLVVLHSFDRTNKQYQGYEPHAGVILDPSSGALIGTTMTGAANYPICYSGCGTVFRLSQNQAGSYKSFSRLHVFRPDLGDGWYVETSPTLDAQGNLYGAADFGGDSSRCTNGYGCGAVFMLPPQPTQSTGLANAAERRLHVFEGGLDGAHPRSPLLQDPNSGVLYGTTCEGGKYGAGTFYSLTPNAKRTAWSHAVLFSFDGGTGGMCPSGGLAMDPLGVIYGTAGNGGDGNCNCGLVFELRLKGTRWKEKSIHIFTYASGEGRYPTMGIVFDKAGDMYGTTLGGGNDVNVCSSGCGTVFRLTRHSQWSETVLHRFNFSKGATPVGDQLAIDEVGNLYGTTQIGGPNDYGQGGTVFELVKSGNTFAFKTLHFFCSEPQCKDGQMPLGGVILGASGTLYGSTFRGGKFSSGEVFALSP